MLIIGCVGCIKQWKMMLLVHGGFNDGSRCGSYNDTSPRESKANMSHFFCWHLIPVCFHLPLFIPFPTNSTPVSQLYTHLFQFLSHLFKTVSLVPHFQLLTKISPPHSNLKTSSVSPSALSIQKPNIEFLVRKLKKSLHF